jgi:hypothetical protein
LYDASLRKSGGDVVDVLHVACLYSSLPGNCTGVTQTAPPIPVSRIIPGSDLQGLEYKAKY